MIERVAVDALLLRTQLPELSLREGSNVVARVAARAEAHGVLVLAGVPLTAQLPPEVQAGQTLHLRVEEVTPERVTLRLDPQAAGVAPPRSRSRSTPRSSAGSTCAWTSRAAR